MTSVMASCLIKHDAHSHIAAHPAGAQLVRQRIGSLVDCAALVGPSSYQ